jgi:hypothetical protein
MKEQTEQLAPEECRYIYEERAAIHEFLGGLPRHLAEVRAFLETGGSE